MSDALDAGGPQGPPPTSTPGESVGGGAGAGLDLDRLAREARYLLLADTPPPFQAWDCAEAVLALVERVRTQDAALAEVNTWLVDWVKAGSHTQEWQFYIGRLFAALAAAGGTDGQ